MKYINTLKEGDRGTETYLCKKKTQGISKTGKAFESLTLCDKSGTIDAKIWDVDSEGISDYDELDFITVTGDITSWNGALQFNIKRLRKANPGEFEITDYIPSSKKDIGVMWSDLMKLINSVKTPYFKALLNKYFVEDKDFIEQFKSHSAAKSVHHGFTGGLLEHTLSVATNCDYFSGQYPFLDRDLLITAAIFHDIGKVRELSEFPRNDYTDEGQLLGHIYVGANMLDRAIDDIAGFPEVKRKELIHCILSHHGELEYGSPKKPAIAEAIALSFADNLDAKLETIYEALENVEDNNLTWQGFNRLLDSNIRRTGRN
ncbi:3'-5' exoribonuclease [Pseudobutyrivibrio sp. ACV-2]|uniref:3'-5' exoribonuclease YhaM family protein n=1 Tax=Pseudobutyrivibrio sp. ACV-2 TaxID=1520801 RepID=UPI00089A1596|nr:HD domain-containing protein [Pseudobutyrivibrio sp. ACV-2]SEA72783.1 3'-5' exoribonuclease [Pseudobutyrivibrio sp. ACV-2]